MKPSILPLAAGLLIGLGSLSIHANAQAAAMVPANTVFQAGGDTDLMVGPFGAPCVTTIHGSIDGNGNASVDGTLTQSDGTSVICKVIQGAGQWTLTPTSATTAELRDIQLGASGLVTCTGNVSGEVIDGMFSFYGELEADNGNVCHFSGTLQTSPAIGISWP